LHIDWILKPRTMWSSIEVCTQGLELLLLAGATKVIVYGDSHLVILQSKKECEVRHERLKEYQALVEDLSKRFVKIEFCHVPRDENRKADALATLASSLMGGDMIPILVKRKDKPSFQEICMIAEVETELPWYYDILRLIRDDIYPDEATNKDKKVLKRSRVCVEKRPTVQKDNVRGMSEVH